MTEWELNRLIKGVTDLRDKTILETMYASGCRPKELRDMRISKIDFAAREIRVMGKDEQGGYRRERIVLVTEKALRLIKKYFKTRRPAPGFEDILFLNDSGEALSPYELNSMVRQYVREILGKEIKHPNAAYILRHSFATILLNRDVQLPFISELMGHKNFTGTQVYTHTAVKRLMEVHKRCHPRGM